MRQEINRNNSGETDIPEGAVLAALDLGSNSFHLIIVRIEHHEMRPIETLSEKVQLGAGLRNGILEEDAMQRGLDCLSRFKQVLDSIEPYRTRIVATNALRQARNRAVFVRRARSILGISIEVIYGREEARLVYLGVAHTLADDESSRLVVDIGGGSTELIVGRRFEPLNLDSLQIGCVSYTRNYFNNGKITRRRYGNAYEATRLEVSHIRNRYNANCWQDCVGSSGTLRAIEALLLHFSWSEEGITRPGLSRLESALLNFRHTDDLDMEGLSDNRRNVIMAGVAITSGIFDELGIELMRTSPGALREGVIYDLLGRLSHEDVRERTISALMQRYGVDEEVAATVEKRVRILYRCVRKVWRLDKQDWEILRWSALTHEIGLAISHKNFHRHGAYLLLNADLPGFSQGEQELLALLVQFHRRKIRLSEVGKLVDGESVQIMRLLCLLRLANIFKYVEQLESLPEFRVEAHADAISLQFPDNWLEQHPLTNQELKLESAELKRRGIRLLIG